MNREKMIEELEDVFFMLKPVRYPSEYAAIAVDYMLEKFGPLVDAADTIKGAHETWCRCAVCQALKQLEGE